MPRRSASAQRVHGLARFLPVGRGRAEGGHAVVARDDGKLGANITRSTADCYKAEQELAETTAKVGPGAVAGLLQKGQGLPCPI